MYDPNLCNGGMSLVHWVPGLVPHKAVMCPPAPLTYECHASSLWCLLTLSSSKRSTVSSHMDFSNLSISSGQQEKCQE